VASKKDIERLLKKASLSGLEAARLIIGHHVEQDHQRDGFLSEREISYIKSRLTPLEAAEYNRWVDTYRIVDRTLQEAHVLALDIQQGLIVASQELDRYFIEYLLQQYKMWTPTIVTEKQYQDIKDRQREQYLQDIYSLRFMLERVAEGRTSEDIWAEWEEREEEEYYLDFMAERYPELYMEAGMALLELMRAGQLQPIQLQPQDIERLEQMREQRRAQANETTQELLARSEEYDQTQRKLYEASKRKQRQARSEQLAQALEQLLEGALNEQEKERLLDATFCSGAELYEAGLAEWRTWIDEFRPDPIAGYAVIPPGNLFSMDEQGYYKPGAFGDALEMVSGVEVMDKIWRDRGFSGAEGFHQAVNARLRSQLRGYLGLQSIVETVSDILGVDFAEDLRAWHGQIKNYVDRYNVIIRPDSDYAKDIPKLRKLRIDNLKPSAASLRYFRERIALGLGEGWQEAALNLWPAEAEPEEEEPEEVASGQEA